ncbi:FUSC family protein [Kitasatospora sp. NPDC008050]|uniref:FUSC family protein n=1 Tax=Kitasatospora sp. NPDC008050 TaxID=3364021 RepID=UPI0036E733D1
MSSSSSAPHPPWWAHAARPARPAVPWALMVRAAAGTALPLFAGLACGRLGFGVFAALGAMHATINDRVEPAWSRVQRIGSAVGASALGMVIGGALRHFDVPLLAAVAVLTLLGFASGALSATGPRGSGAGMLLLVSAALGDGMAPAHPWWAAGPLMLLGAGLVLLLGLPYRPARPADDPRVQALAAVYQALGGLLAALGTPQGASARRVLTARLNQLQDLLQNPLGDLLPRPRRPRDRTGPRPQDSAQLRRLHRAYEAALAASEAATGLLWAQRPVPPEVAALPTALARQLTAPTADTPTAAPTAAPADTPPLPNWSPDTPARQALDAALRTAADAVAGRAGDPATAVRAAAAPPPDPWRLRARLLSRGSVRYGSRVALCVAVAEVVTAGLPLDRAYWVPMTVAFVLKPDLGSVFLRAVSRAVGTVLGVALTAALLSLTTEPWLLAAVAALCVALLPYSAAAHYGLNTAVMTPMALVLVQLGGQSGVAEVGPRVLDTVLASLIVLVFGYLLWPERAPHRIEPRIVAATGTLRAYLLSVTDPINPADPAAPTSPAAPAAQERAPSQVWLRRTAYRALADARQEVRHGLTEPPPAGRRAEAWLPATAALERLGGAVAAYAAQLRYGGRANEPQEVARVLAALDQLATAARAHRPPDGRTERPTGPHNPERSALAQAAGELEQLLS